MERVFPDSNVLYPISLADLLLRLGDIAIHEVLWSEDLLAEVEDILVRRKGLTAGQAAYFCRCIRGAFPEGQITRSTYEHLIATRVGPDPDDHPHSAAAVAGGATVLLTSDKRGFPAEDLSKVRVFRLDISDGEIVGSAEYYNPVTAAPALGIPLGSPDD